jgi:hypothetical protein
MKFWAWCPELTAKDQPMKKRVLRPERLRKVPPQFSWIDHRLVRDNYFPKCDHSAWTLYLFLVNVADAQGLSYYSDASLMRRLNLDPLQLSASRQQLLQAGLIAYEKPLCQVLSVEAAQSTRSGQTSVAEILRKALGAQP